MSTFAKTAKHCPLCRRKAQFPSQHGPACPVLIRKVGGFIKGKHVSARSQGRVRPRTKGGTTTDSIEHAERTLTAHLAHVRGERNRVALAEAHVRRALA